MQYALDKAELLVDENVNSEDSLDFLYTTLIDNPNIVIELQAHTRIAEVLINTIKNFLKEEHNRA